MLLTLLKDSHNEIAEINASQYIAVIMRVWEDLHYTPAAVYTFQMILLLHRSINQTAMPGPIRISTDSHLLKVRVAIKMYNLSGLLFPPKKKLAGVCEI